MGYKYFHYSLKPLTSIESVKNDDPCPLDGMKPRGLWFTTNGKDSWYEWCKSESFRLETLTCKTQIIFKPKARVLHLKGAEDLDKFTKNFERDMYPDGISQELSAYSVYRIDWQKVAISYQAIIIAPYCWQRRLSLMWYYCWDCASGCVWDKEAVAEIRLIKSKKE